MTIGLILKRMRREWRALAILLLAVCLLTGFFALGPFYIRAVTNVGLRFELDQTAPEDRQISLVLDNEPLSPEALRVVGEELGSLVVDYRHFIRADYTPPTTTGGMDNSGLATGGYDFLYGEAVTATSPRQDHTFQPYAFDNMPDILNLVEGRWPVRLPPPDVVDPTGLSDAEQQARQIGIYNRGEVEVVVTKTVAEEAGLELGSRLVLGTKRLDGTGSTASIVVVGIVEPKNSADPFWVGSRNFLEGSMVTIGLVDERYDYGMATIPEAYTDWLRPVTPGNSYIYQISTNTDTIDANNITEINRHLAVLQNRLSAYHPGIQVLTGLSKVLEGYSSNVSDTEGPIILLSGAILILMLYHLINTVALVLEQQGTEWSSIVSRGGSIPQLIALQFATVGVLGLIGMVAGPLLSILFMHLLEHFGPLATALGGRPLGATAIPRISIYLSIGAAVSAVVVLTLPALPAARRSLLRLKQLVSRPPTRPTWARYGLDFVLMAVGVGFMLRLYYLVGGDFGKLLNNLFAAPREVIQLIADNLSETGGLNDPFNLLGPALVLTGAALLWLRFFPWLMGAIARLVQNSSSLTTPLAVWNVARDPGHYAQLVLLLIGTLALGTASLGLTATRDKGAWSTAREETGAGARVEIDPTRLDASTVRWDRLPGVATAVPLLHVLGDTGSSGQRDVHVIGVDPAAFAAAFPTLASDVAALKDIQTPVQPGILLPEDATTLSVQVYSLPPANADDPGVSVALSAYLQDALGVPYRVLLHLPDMALSADGASADDVAAAALPTPTDQWLNFAGNLPKQGRRPFTLMRLGLDSVEGNIDAFEHTIYLDRIATLDVFGTASTLESFEDAHNAWSEATVSNPYAASWTDASNQSLVGGITMTRVTDAVPEVDGAGALRLDYRMGKVGGRQREPSVVVNPPDLGRVPVVVNQAFVQQFAGRGTVHTAADEPLSVGDERNVILNLGTGSVEIGYQIVGIIDGLPSVGEQEPLMLTPLALIQPVINQAASAMTYFGENQVWLELPDRKPSSALKAEIGKLDGVTTTVWAWDRYGEIQREPLPSAVAGMLFAGFWISLLLSLLDFAFYLVVTARQRLFTFAVLRSLGWNAANIWRLLFIEQIALITPALLIGSVIGAGLAYLLLPFLALVGGESLQLPWLSLLGLLLTLVLSFTLLMAAAAILLRRMSVNQVLRLGEE